MHCFSGDLQLAEKTMELGFFISVPGIVTFAKADELQEVAARVPLSSLLLETDGPYLAPNPKRGKRNEPAYLAPYRSGRLRTCAASPLESWPTATARTPAIFSNCRPSLAERSIG